MRIRKLSVVLIAISAALLLLLLSSVAKASESNQETKMTFNQPVEVPGRVLPAGTYDFSLLNSPSDRQIVEIRSKDDMHLLALVMTQPVERSQPAGHTKITLEKVGANQPEAIQTWFYPGDLTGHEFIYPDSQHPASALGK
ncbi:MAG TPA: hypothetical protein VMH20_10970 [Verrucomicrobiae bacterium]|nr:hypothetical protein [Verrucomicrobiae bacterium]